MGVDSLCLQAVLCNKECVVWYYLIWLSLQPGFHTMSLFPLTSGIKNVIILLEKELELVQQVINHCWNKENACIKCKSEANSSQLCL